MTYLINEIFYSIQGEGYWTGRPAVFVRFSRCNLWSGHEKDRESAICQFCDTDFVDGTEYTAEEILDNVNDLWPGGGDPMVIFTGGEPLLQLDNELIDKFHDAGWYSALETNGTLSLPMACSIDWVCISPKTPRVNVPYANELKLVYPQQRITPGLYQNYSATHFWLSPMDGPNLAENTKAAFDYCLENPEWRLNIQSHKVIGVR